MKGHPAEDWWKYGPPQVMCTCCYEQIVVSALEMRTCLSCQYILHGDIAKLYDAGVIKDKYGTLQTPTDVGA